MNESEAHPGAAVNSEQTTISRVGPKLAPFNPASEDVVDTALEMLKICDGDVLYDLGCGDARLLVRACQRNINLRAVGVEYDLELYSRAREMVINNGLENKVAELLVRSGTPSVYVK